MPSRKVNPAKQKIKNSPSVTDLGKVQLQGVVQHNSENLEHVSISSLSPRENSAVEVMRLEFRENFEIKRLHKIISFFPKSLFRTRGKKRKKKTKTFQHLATCII